MSKSQCCGCRKLEHRRYRQIALLAGVAWLAACGRGATEGSAGSGGGSGQASGGTTASSDTGGTGGQGGNATGGAANGGQAGGGTGGNGTGGSATGGTASSGGVATGGQSGGAGGNTSGGVTGRAGTSGSGSAGGTGGRSGGTGGAAGVGSGGNGGSPPDGSPPGEAGVGDLVDANAADAADGAAGAIGPCDLYAAGNTPCVAAHSTARALYGAYAGSLYQIRRTSDKTTRNIGVVTAGGFADSAAQESFCAGTKCTISIIYDQSPRHNDLTLTKGGWIGDRAKEADAFGVSTTLSGHKVYGVHVPLSTDRATGVGYRNNTATGTARGDEPESMYMVANGKAFSNECCFDYGNASTTSVNNGPGTMEAIYFGNCTAWGSGDGKGPWVMADLEEGLFSGKAAKLNSANKSIPFDYVTAVVKGKPQTFAIKAGDAQTGSLTTMYEGGRPNASALGAYDPMKKEGGIILGTGGDNSFMGVGDFFEGAMTAGYASDATDDAVQANVVAAGYGR